VAGVNQEDVEKLLAMQEEVARQLRALGVHGAGGATASGDMRITPPEEQLQADDYRDKSEAQADAALLESDKPARRRPGTFSKVAGGQGVKMENTPARTSVGQLYEVVFRPMVAVRARPTIDSRCLRALKYGMTVQLYEWDSTRKWRRISMYKIAEVDAVVYHDDVYENEWEVSDGWVLIQHPMKGPLLKAVTTEAAYNNEWENAYPHHLPKLGATVAPLAEAGAEVIVGEAAAAPPDGGASPPLRPPQKQESEEAEEEERVGTSAAQSGSSWGGTSTAVAAANGTADALTAAVDDKSASRLPDDQQRDARDRMLAALEVTTLASVDDRSHLGEPKIMRATRTGNCEVVRNILMCKADANAVDAMGWTALFEAVSAGFADVAALLLDHGADPGYIGKDGTTAMMLAEDSAIQSLLKTSSDSGLVEASPRLLPEVSSPPSASSSPAEVPSAAAALVAAGGFGASCGGSGDTTTPAAKEAAPFEENEGAAALAAAVATVATPAMPKSADVPTALAPAGAEEEIVEFNEDGIPVRIETPTMYLVVFKMVAVRRYPNATAPSLRGKKAGELVEMYEWDHTRRWRRVRAEAPSLDEEDIASDGSAPLKEVDGWMLIKSDKLGPLLQPVASDDSDVDEAG